MEPEGCSGALASEQGGEGGFCTPLGGSGAAGRRERDGAARSVRAVVLEAEDGWVTGWP